MAKKKTYKVEINVNLKALEDVINEYVSKDWILDQVLVQAWDTFTVIFRDK